MANKLRKKTKQAEEEPKPAPSDLKDFKKEKEEAVDWKSLARDERTWKITGSVFLLISIFLFISFASYLFTWKEDQAIARQGMGALLDREPVANLLGRLGAVVSHFFIFKAFGIASFLICTFFFVVGVNLLFRRKVFSIWRNLKYVTVGLLVLSVSLSFIFQQTEFSYGGGVGDMINDKLYNAVGTLGTAAILLLLAAGYFIWQFNPGINLPEKKQTIPEPVGEAVEEKTATDTAVAGGLSINDLYAGKEAGKTNSLKGDSGMVINFPDEIPLHDFKVVEKETVPEKENTTIQEQVPEKKLVNDIQPAQELAIQPLSPDEEEEMEENETYLPPVQKRTQAGKTDGELELEIKAVPEMPEEEETTLSAVENLPPYEPTLDLRDYKYPTLTLLETYGGEKIIQDTGELESHKNQIIATLRNYSIEIQKISATIGPTVTLYEIVPAPGVRISRIKNLEDDIALSLAALGIRIIAPIPGKGTIGIEVPISGKRW